MSTIFRLVTILITSFGLTLAGTVASPVATANENETVRITAGFSSGSSALTKAQKAAIESAVTASGASATFLVTGVAGKLPGVSNKAVKSLAKKRAQAVKAYLVKLGVSKANITTKVKVSEIGIVLANKIVRTSAVPAVIDTSAAAPAPAPVIALSCAAGGTCIVGDVGPGGGTVYYVDNSHSGFNCGPTMVLVCHYLEVAPSGWITGSSSIVWATGDSTSGYAVTLVPGIVESTLTSALNDSSEIGLGYKNSLAIVSQNNNAGTVATIAAGAARAYAGNAKIDWYLPTTAELNLLCQWNHGVAQVVTTKCTGGTRNAGTGASSSGFAGLYYWSSSEQLAGYSWIQSFIDGDQTGYQKGAPQSIRPIRAF